MTEQEARPVTETRNQRLHRNYAELLQEVRVAQTGVQLLLGFLLTLAFTPRFTSINDFQRNVYLISLRLGAAATALMIAPAAFHRVVFGCRLRQALVRISNRLVLGGLTLLMAALSGSLLLILDMVLGLPRSAMITGGLTAWFALFWYVLPLYTRARRPSDEHSLDDHLVRPPAQRSVATAESVQITAAA